MIEAMAVIGDVHGEYHRLVRLLEKPDLNGRHVVFLGDLIDRGPDSFAVLESVSYLTDNWTPGVTVLRGNHEQILLDFLQSSDASAFLRNGGLTTIASYQGKPPGNVLEAFRAEFPERHLRLLRESRTHLENRHILMSHMGYNPKNPRARDLRNMVLEPHLDLFKSPPAPGPPLTICGHYAQRTRRVFDSGRLLCIDTGSGVFSGAPLTAVLLPERKIVQAWR
jgi:serine/threonine protein phosphatase 1